MTAQQLAELVLGHVDERGRDLERIRRAHDDGYAAGEAAHADDYERGYHDGLMADKRVQHQLYDATDLELRRWELRGEPRTRATFADPHPDDFEGGTE
jgi:hypothetical protein